MACTLHCLKGPIYGGLDVELIAKAEKKIMTIKGLSLLLLVFLPYRNLGNFIFIDTKQIIIFLKN
jgi:hypothetical protein